MNSSATTLRQAADAVDALGGSSADYNSLTDAQMLEGQNQIAALRRLSETRAAWMAGAIAVRSRPELGGSGLSATQGYPTPEMMVQKLLGTTRTEAVKLLAVGTMLADTEAAERLAGEALDLPDLAVPVPWLAPVSHSVTNGELSVDAASAIQRGLGDIDTSVTAEKLAVALEGLLGEAPAMHPDELFKRARRMRDHLDEEGILAREKQADADTVLKIWRRPDGKVAVHGVLPPETGEWWLSTYDCLTSPRRGGVRFVDKARAEWAERILNDPRTTDQIAADGLTELLKLGSQVDPGKLLGGRRPAVRVIVTKETLAGRKGHGYVEGNPTPISFETVEQHLCESGMVQITLDDTGNCLDMGRSERLFTEEQRAALAARDGGCMWPDCDRPASWSEAHHLEEWLAGNGATDIDNGILLCHRDHLRLHNNGWTIFRDELNRFWLKPPASLDPNQRPFLLKSKSPTMLEKHEDVVPGSYRE